MLALAQAPEPGSLQQIVAMQRAWGPKTNSAGATLTLTEGSRTTSNGRAVVRYRMITSGLPKGQTYSLVMWQLGGQPQGILNGVTLDATGTAICGAGRVRAEGTKLTTPLIWRCRLAWGKSSEWR